MNCLHEKTIYADSFKTGFVVSFSFLIPTDPQSCNNFYQLDKSIDTILRIKNGEFCLQVDFPLFFGEKHEIIDRIFTHFKT